MMAVSEDVFKDGGKCHFLMNNAGAYEYPCFLFENEKHGRQGSFVMIFNDQKCRMNTQSLNELCLCLLL